MFAVVVERAATSARPWAPGVEEFDSAEMRAMLAMDPEKEAEAEPEPDEEADVTLAARR